MTTYFPKLRITIADTPSKQARGLMFVNKLPEDKGMLFVFAHQRILSFWGENTLIPLDIAFADIDGNIREMGSISAFSRKAVRSSVPCVYAVEANVGYFSENKIGIGDKIEIEEDADGHYLSFAKKRRNVSAGKGRKITTITAQLVPDMDNTGDFGVDDAQSRYDSLPKLSPGDIGSALEDNQEDFTQDVQQPSEEDRGQLPVGLPMEEEPIEEAPQFDNAFDATEWAKPTMENGFEGSPMRIDYTTKSGNNIIRDVEPHGMFHSESTGNQVMVTYDKTIGDIRAFIVGNINSFSFLDEKFEPKFRI